MMVIRSIPVSIRVFSILLLTGVLFSKHVLATSLASDPNLPIVKAHCTACHSASIIVQNRLSREGWKETIRWMQEKQGLWPLGQHEKIILDYLEKHYYPVDSGRRKPLPKHLLPPANDA